MQSLGKPDEMPIELFDKFDRLNIKDAWGVFRTPALHDLIGNNELVAVPNIEEAKAFDATAILKVESMGKKRTRTHNFGINTKFEYLGILMDTLIIGTRSESEKNKMMNISILKNMKLPEIYEYNVERKSQDHRLIKSFYIKVEEPKLLKTGLSLHNKVPLFIDRFVKGIEPCKQLLIVSDVLVAKRVSIVAVNGKNKTDRLTRMYLGPSPIPLAFKAVVATVGKTGLVTKIKQLSTVEYDDWKRYNSVPNIPQKCTMAYNTIVYADIKRGSSSSEESSEDKSAGSEAKGGSSSSEKESLPKKFVWDEDIEDDVFV